MTAPNNKGEMQVENSKVKIKLGNLEIECEGSESFISKELPRILTHISDMWEKLGNTVPAVTSANSGQNNASEPSSFDKIQMTTGAIASKLKVSSGPELVMAAAGNLSLVQKEKTFSRKRLIEQMRSATAFFKETYVSNLSGTLNRLLKEGKINEPSKDVFALTNDSEQELRSRLA